MEYSALLKLATGDPHLVLVRCYPQLFFHSERDCKRTFNEPSPCKDDNSRFTTVPLKQYSDKNVDDIVTFLTRNVLDSDIFLLLLISIEI